MHQIQYESYSIFYLKWHFHSYSNGSELNIFSPSNNYVQLSSLGSEKILYICINSFPFLQKKDQSLFSVLLLPSLLSILKITNTIGKDPLFSGNWEIQTAIKYYFMTQLAKLTVKLPVTLHLAIFEILRIWAESFFHSLNFKTWKTWRFDVKFG